MKLVTGLALLLTASTIVPIQFCQAGEDVAADTRYKNSQSVRVSERRTDTIKDVQAANTRKAPRTSLRWKRDNTHWYFLRAAEFPWAPNAPGD